MKVTAAAFVLCLAACSADRSDTKDQSSEAPRLEAPTAAAPAPEPAPSSAPPIAEAAPAANILTLKGLGGLRIGEAVPAASGWGTRYAQVPGGCTTISSPDFPGAHAIVEEARVRRITVGQRSDVKLAEGIGVGATEAKVRATFPSFREEPHKYVDAPAKYLTAPNAESGDPALRFEIGADRKVSLIHVGTMPVLGYVEGCA